MFYFNDAKVRKKIGICKFFDDFFLVFKKI